MNTIQEQWADLHKREKAARHSENWGTARQLQKQILELKPKLQAATTGKPASEPENVPATYRQFHFYMLSGSPRTTALIDHVFELWQTFHTFKRQVSPATLQAYRSLIEGVLSNMLYAQASNKDGVLVRRDKADLGRSASHYRPAVYNQRLLTILDDLHTMGWLVQTKGERYKQDYVKLFGITKAARMMQECPLTRLTTGLKLREYLAAQAFQPALEDVFIQTDLQEVVMLKKDERSELVEYEETPRTKKYRRQMQVINNWLTKAGPLLVEGAAFDDRLRFLVRKFTYNNFEKGGRLGGGLWDSPMKKVERPVVLRIQGEPTAEVDYNSIIVHLAYALHGEEPPQQVDMYAIPGLHPESRPGIKKFIGAHLFRESQRKRFPHDQDGESIIKYFHESDQGKSYQQVLDLIARVHPAMVEDFFGTGVGHHLQFLESQLLVNVLLVCARKRIVALPLHDCLIVKASKVELVVSIMEQASMMVLGREIPASVKD